MFIIKGQTKKNKPENKHYPETGELIFYICCIVSEPIKYVEPMLF